MQMARILMIDSVDLGSVKKMPAFPMAGMGSR
jgi:hypothetical protein